MKGEGVGRTSIHDATDPHPALRAPGGQCRGDPVGRPAGLWRADTRDDAVPSCAIAPGRRTASPVRAVGAAGYVVPTNITARPAHQL